MWSSTSPAFPITRSTTRQIPACTYTHPQVASMGQNEKKLREQGRKLKIGKFPFSASGRALAAGETEGFVKLIFDAQYGELLGVHMIGENVTELLSELVMARKLEATEAEIIEAMHPHPTMSEAVMEAAGSQMDGRFTSDACAWELRGRSGRTKGPRGRVAE